MHHRSLKCMVCISLFEAQILTQHEIMTLTLKKTFEKMQNWPIHLTPPGLHYLMLGNKTQFSFSPSQDGLLLSVNTNCSWQEPVRAKCSQLEAIIASYRQLEPERAGQNKGQLSKARYILLQIARQSQVEPAEPTRERQRNLEPVRVIWTQQEPARIRQSWLEPNGAGKCQLKQARYGCSQLEPSRSKQSQLEQYRANQSQLESAITRWLLQLAQASSSYPFLALPGCCWLQLYQDGSPCL